MCVTVTTDEPRWFWSVWRAPCVRPHPAPRARASRSICRTDRGAPCGGGEGLSGHREAAAGVRGEARLKDVAQAFPPSTRLWRTGRLRGKAEALPHDAGAEPGAVVSPRRLVASYTAPVKGVQEHRRMLVASRGPAVGHHPPHRAVWGRAPRKFTPAQTRTDSSRSRGCRTSPGGGDGRCSAPPDTASVRSRR